MTEQEKAELWNALARLEDKIFALQSPDECVDLRQEACAQTAKMLAATAEESTKLFEAAMTRLTDSLARMMDTCRISSGLTAPAP